jgi:hypothetical protein
MRMSHILLCTGAVLVGSPSFAQTVLTDTATGSVGVNGNVARLCALGAPSPSNVALGAMVDTGGARAGQLSTIAPRNVSLPNSWCNYAGTRLSVQADAMLTGQTAPTGFTRTVNYTASVAGWAASSAAVTTSAAADGSNPRATSNGSTVVLPKVSDLTLTFSSFAAPADARPVAGTYQGTVVIVLGPDVGAAQ